MLVALGHLFLLLNLPGILGQKEEIHYYDDPDDENEEMKQRDRNISYHNWVRQIEKDVLSKVSYKVAPYTDQQIDVQFIFHSVDHVVINEKEQVMSISGRYCMIWRDPHITWDPAKYNNLDTLHVGSYDVWTPRIIVLNGLSGVYSHLDAPVSRVKLFIPRFRANEPAYVITCPRYTGRVGCYLDMTNYPHDSHVCSFIMSAKDQTNVVFYAGRRMQANRDFSVNLRHVLTRNDTRPRVSGWHINNVTSRISYYDYSNITATKTTPLSITVAIQTVHFSRNEPSYVYTQTVPALIFVSFNIAGALVQDCAHSMFLFLTCLLFQGLFIRDFIDRIPLYYNSLPKIREVERLHEPYVFVLLVNTLLFSSILDHPTVPICIWIHIRNCEGGPSEISTSTMCKKKVSRNTR
ncbi:hypothetical protein ANCCAN_13878 [Ancylostoma caninum]|uniref:Neurotransmitter-gated ion-channel ligand-binding domain-containing protein n=1 Tax=Ancylostoma caninum TaxID=29170 RepID=A0A368G6Y4_ANCCA|nr:hypothetical protein ANCCAN_13878 [Ancylostoma caninum]